MSWLNDVAGSLGWLATETTTGQSPQQLQQAFQMLGTDSETFASWWEWSNTTHLPPIGPGGGRPNLGQWLTSTTPQSLGGATTTPATKLTTATGTLSSSQLGGNDPNVIAAIIRAAQETGVDPRLALAIAYNESGFDPGATGDQGCSHGIFQLNACAGEGVGVPQYQLNDPYSNAKIALTQVAQVMRANPGMNPGQIAAAAQRPADPSGYVASINNYMDSIQTGQGPLAWANVALQNPTLGGLGSMANQLGGTLPVPVPFPVSYFQSPSLTFGQQFQGETEEGVDYPMPEGTELVSPVGGTIELQDDDGRNWGKRVLVHTPNGWTFAIGHVQNFAVTNGQTINQGEVLGTSGGGPQSSSPGFSSGPHIEAQFIDPSGKFVDPAPILQQVFSGTTFDKWYGGLFLGSTQIPGQPAQQLIRTPDNQLVDYNTPEGAWYKVVDSAWQSIYGQHAPFQAAVDFRNAGITTVDALTNAINQLPSAIPGVTIGQYKSVSDTVQKQAQTSFGRPVPQSLLQELFQQGITTASDIRLWFEEHSSSDIPQGDYQAIYDSAAPYTQKLVGDVPHPSDVAAVYQTANGALPASLGTTDVNRTIQDYTAGVF